MKENKLSSAFKGFIELDQVKGELEGFVNYVKSDLNDELKMVRPAMLVVAQSEEQALLFAQGAISILREEHLSSYYVIRPSFLWNRPISDEYDCVLVNDFDDKLTELNELERIKKRLTRTVECTRSDLVTIFCTTEARAQQYREFYKEDFYKLFQSRIHLAPYTIDNIKDGAHYCFDEWAERNEIQLEEGFYPQLNDWIETVYGRADKKGKEFVEGLKERLIKQSKILGKPYVFGADTIPFYRPRDVLKDIKEEMNKDELLLWSQDFDAFLEEIRNKVSNNVDKKSYNLVVSAKSESAAQRLAKFYARILNSKEYHITSSKMMISVDIGELQEIENFEKQNGVVFVKGFSSIIESDEIELALKRLKTISESSMNDLVFVLYDEATVDEKKSTEDLLKQRLELFGLNTAFNFFFDLNKHNMESSLRLVSYKLKLQNKKMDKSKKKMLAQWVSNLSTLKDANKVIKYGIDDPNTITEEAGYTDEQKFKLMQQSESKLGENSRKIKKNRRERNVLLLSMSTLNKVAISEYNNKIWGNNERGYYISQLEPIPKILAGMLHAQGDKLDTIYVLNTDKTLHSTISKDIADFTDTGKNVDFKEEPYTAFSYFKERCKKFVEASKIKSISIGGDEENDIEGALYEVTNRLRSTLSSPGVEKINLYVDMHGGLRFHATVIDAILILIKDIDNIELKDIYTVVYNNKIGTFKSALDTNKIYEFIGGMQEFLSFGRSNGLIKFNETNSDEKEKKLAMAINEISDSILLNEMDSFSSNLKRLCETLNGRDQLKGYYGVVQDLLLNDYKVKIKGETYDLLGNDSEYLPAQLQWCLNKKLLQQALVLIESQTEQVLCDKNIIKSSNKKKSSLFKDWIIYSLCENAGDKYILGKYSKKKNPFKSYIYLSGDKNENIKGGLRVLSDHRHSYFDCYKAYFNGISIESDEKLVVDKIKKLYCNDGVWDITKYYQLNYNCNDGEEYIGLYRKKDKNKAEYSCVKYFDVDLKKIPVHKKLLAIENREYLEDLYVLLYIYKGLKKYRNKVAHVLVDEGDKLTREEIEKWIQLYVIRLDKLLKDTSSICSKKGNK